jgi:hypothetical protein
VDPVERLTGLLAQLDAQEPKLHRMRDYYRGRSADPYVPHQAGPEVKRLAALARTRWAGLVVDSVAERLVVDGVKCSDPSMDAVAWGWWQASSLDARQSAVHTDALVQGSTHVLVWPGDGDGAAPAIRGLDRRDSIGRTLGWDPWLLSEAAYRWVGPAGVPMAALYDADAAFMFARTPGRGDMAAVARWWRDDPDTVTVGPEAGWMQIDEVPHGLGECPVVRVANVPDLRGDGVSDIEDHTPAIDRITETVMGRLTAGKFGAYRQRWASGQPLGNVIDPATGEPILGADGKPLPAGAPFKYGSDMVWVSEDPETKFGDFAATDLRPIIEAVDQDIKHLAAATRTPAHYLLAGISNPPSAEALLAAQDGLMAKVHQRQLDFGEAWEHVIRLAGRAAGNDTVAGDDELQVVWRNTEVRSPGAVADALLKLRQVGIPLQVLLEQQGNSPQTIERIMADVGAEQQRQASAQATAYGLGGQAA